MQVTKIRRWIFFQLAIDFVSLYSVHGVASTGVVKDYVFDVSYFKANPDNTKAAWIQGINSSLPGPTIRVKRGDRLRLTVINNCQTEKLSLHFHGFEMRHAQEYDGAMPITQCGIRPGTTMVYEFDVDEHPGTYTYHEHAHLTHVAGIGFFGVIIVEEDATHSMWSSSHCSHCDIPLAIFDYWTHSPHHEERVKIGRRARPPMVSDQSNGVGLLEFNNLLINGKGAFNVFGAYDTSKPTYVTAKTRVTDLFQLAPSPGETWRLRIINAGSLFAFRFRIDGHRLKVIQSDGADVTPFECDAITLSSGERFDVLVEFNKDPGSYWMRAETLEKTSGMHHGQLGVVRYSNTPQGVIPDKGYPIAHIIEDDPSLVTLNCVDQAPSSPTCLPLTALRRNQDKHATYVPVGHVDEEPHDFEVSLRAWYGLINAHMTRVIDLKNGGNTIGKNQFDGVFTEFAFPAVPYSYVDGTSRAEHENTVKMEVSFNETVRVIIQSQDRAAHPWHLHGHKFAVLAQGFPDYKKDCDILYCRSENNHWISRDGAIQANGKFTSFGTPVSNDKDHKREFRYPLLLDPQEAPLKDTVHLPAGGWVVIQFKADNPGWWFFHCHMAIHAHGGMALVLVEAREQMPARLIDTAYLDGKGFPSCDKELKHFKANGVGKSCACYQNAEMKLDNFPRDTYNCTNTFLCGQLLLNPLEPSTPSHMEGARRDLGDGTPWRIAMLSCWCVAVSLLFIVKRWFQAGFSRHHSKTLVSAEKREHILRHGTHTSKVTLAAHAIEDRVKNHICDAAHAVKDVAHAIKELGHTHPQATAAEASGSAPLRGEALIETDEEKAARALYSLPLDFVACQGGKPDAPAAAGTLEPGSLMLMIGAPKHTAPWINFFAARVDSSVGVVRGNINLGGQHLADWERHEIRQSFGFIGQPLEALRPSIAVLEALDLYMHLAPRDALHKTSDDKAQYRQRLITILKLKDHLATPMEKLKPDILLRVRIAQELMLPRSILVLQEPLCRLNARQAKKVTKMLSLVAKDLSMTIILSAEHVIGDVGKFATHGLVATKEMPVFGTQGNIESFCGILAAAEPDVPYQRTGINVFEHCSYLFAKNHFENLTAAAVTRNSTNSTNLPEISVAATGTEATVAMAPTTSIGSYQHNIHFGDYNFQFKPHDSKEAFGINSIMETSTKTLGHRILLSLGFMQSGKAFERPPRKVRSIPRQVATLTYFQLLKCLKEFVTVYALVEKLSLGMVAGIVWWRKGHLNTQTSLGEIFGLLFFTTGLHTVPPVFQALHEVPMIVRLAREEYSGGLYHLYSLAIAMFFSTFMTLAAVWPSFWQIIVYTCAEVSPSPVAMVKMHIVLALNVLTMHTMGLVIALVVPPAATNVVVGNLIAQLFMLTNGFYTKLPDEFMWITFFSIPRYTLKALVKLSFTWDDTFKANPMVGLPAFGFPTTHLPAQLTGLFLTMEERQMDVMKTGEQLGAFPEILALLIFIVIFHVIFITLLFVQVHCGESTRTKYADSTFNVLDTSAWKPYTPPSDDALASSGSPSPRNSPREAESAAVEGDPNRGISAVIQGDVEDEPPQDISVEIPPQELPEVNLDEDGEYTTAI